MINLPHLKLLGSLLNVISSCCKNLFIPVSRDWGLQALVVTDGVPSKTMTRSAKDVAIMKSCSTMNPVFFACKMKRLMTWKRKRKYVRRIYDFVNIFLPWPRQDVAQNPSRRRVRRSDKRPRVCQGTRSWPHAAILLPTSSGPLDR